MKLRGSTWENKALRAADLADQFQEAVYQAPMVPIGPVDVMVTPSVSPAPIDGLRTVYLCGGIHALTDYEACHWRDVARSALMPDFAVLDPMRRDFRGREAEHVKEIVSGDLADIAASHIVLVNAERPGWGTAMEVYASYTSGKLVIACAPGPRISPWLQHFTHQIFPDLYSAVAYIRSLS